MNREIFSQRLKLLRTEKMISMQFLAEKVGLKNKGSISQFENQTNIPSTDTLIAIADFLNVNLDYLTGRPDAKEPVFITKNPEPLLDSETRTILQNYQKLPKKKKDLVKKLIVSLSETVDKTRGE